MVYGEESIEGVNFNFININYNLTTIVEIMKN